MKVKVDYLNKFVELSLKIANIVDRHGEQNDYAFADELGLGYLALSGYLRNGVKAVIDMQADYSNAVSRMQNAEISEKDARAFLADIFGDEDIDSISEENKEKLRQFVKESGM